jgi:hypothetical protein
MQKPPVYTADDRTTSSIVAIPAGRNVFGSVARSRRTVYGGKGHLYTPGVRPASLVMPCLDLLETPC